MKRLYCNYSESLSHGFDIPTFTISLRMPNIFWDMDIRRGPL